MTLTATSRRVWLLVLVVGLLVALGLSTAPTSEAATGEGGTISGHLTRADGKGAEGVSVSARVYVVGEWGPYAEYSPVRTVSDTNGDYTLEFPEDGVYLVCFDGFHGDPYTSFYPDCYGTSDDGVDAQPFTVTGGVAITGIDADLVSQATEYVTFEGKVTNLAGTGLSGMGVRLYCSDQLRPGVWFECMETTTRADGSYSLEELSRGEYRLSFWDPDDVYEYEYYDNAPFVWHGTTITSSTIGETKQIPAVALAKQAVERVVAPSITGKAAVGRTLTVDPGTWSVSDPQLSYQWFTSQDSGPIPGATSRTYVPVAQDEGRSLWAEVTVKAPGLRYFVDTTSQTQPVAAAQTEPDPEPVVEVLTAPVLSGTPAVGKQVSVTAGEWSPSGVGVSYQWLLDGDPIPGATTASYRPKAGDVHAELSVRVTGATAGHTSATSLTEPAKVQQGTIVNETVPSISGRPRVGKELTADSGVWSPRKVDVAYQWLRDGLPVAKATTRRYTVKKADRGHHVSVLVTVAKRAYMSVAMSSPGKKVR